METSSVRVFDGTTDFRVWRARVENELMRYHLLGYVMVRGYDGSQSFMYNGEKVPPRTLVINVDEEQPMVKEEVSCGSNAVLVKGRLSPWDVLGESAEAKSILQRCLHPDVECAILNKNVYDSWKILCVLYGNRNHPGAHDVHEMHRVLHHIRLGDKKGESVREFITRWEMMMQQYALATGIELTDGFRSVSLAQTLPSVWKRMVTSWRGSRPFVPFAELVEKIIVARERKAPIETASAPSLPLMKDTSSVADSPRDQLLEQSAGKSAAVKPGAQSIAKPLEKAGDDAAEGQTTKLASEAAEITVEEPVKQHIAEASETALRPSKAASPPMDATRESRDAVDLTGEEVSATSSGKSKTSSSRRSKKSLTVRSDEAATPPRRSRAPRIDGRHDRTNGYDTRERYDVSYDSDRGNDRQVSSSRYDTSSWKSRDRYEKKYDSYSSYDNKSGLVSCFYCLKLGHHMKRCWYLKDDIENGTTHDEHKKFSCAVTIKRNPFMVSCLDAYIEEVNRERAAYGATSRSHGDYEGSGRVPYAQRRDHHHLSSQPSIYSFHDHRQSSSTSEVPAYRKRSRSEFPMIEGRLSSRDPRLNRSKVAEYPSPRKRSRIDD